MLHLTTSVSIPICTYICVTVSIPLSSVTVGVKGKESQQRVIMTLWLQRLGEILITPDILQNYWDAWGCMGCLWCCMGCMGYTLRLGAGFLLLWLVVVLGFGNV